MNLPDIEAVCGAINGMDIYLLDQLMKGRIKKGMHILDAGCGDGRNIMYLLSQRLHIYGADQQQIAIERTKQKTKEINPDYDLLRFRQEEVSNMSFDDESFDLVISNAVLHFAKDDEHFRHMLDEMWRCLKTGGWLFCRLATSIGIESRLKPAADGHYLLPDGSKRFLATETMLLQHTHRLGARFLEPLKTVNVENSRCMTTWVIEKQPLPEGFPH